MYIHNAFHNTFICLDSVKASVQESGFSAFFLKNLTQGVQWKDHKKAMFFVGAKLNE